MPQLLARPHPPNGEGRVVEVTPESANWRFVGFEAYRLAAGQQLERHASDREACLVLLTGRAGITAGAHEWRDLGRRSSIFEQTPPFAAYVPGGQGWSVTAASDIELAVCSAPASGRAHPPRLITPDDVGVETRGEGTNVRHVHNILPEDEPADSLLVVEVFTPGGHWSSYPPHKHDSERLPEESYLEETYYHRLDPAQGFAFQRVYTDDRSIDETMTVHDGDVVLVPGGYHPVGAPHGYDLYYLNTMAGPERTWRFHNDPAHEWMLG